MAYLCALDKKLDLVVNVLQRQAERLARLECDLGETRRDLGRDIAEVKGDIALLDNKVATAQTEIRIILGRLDEAADRENSEH